MSTIAVLGTGIMGAPIAHNLAAGGFDVRAWNRTPDKARPLADHGITVCRSAKEAARGAGVLLTMVTDATAVEETMSAKDGALAGVDAADVLWLQMSTVGIAGTERLAALAAEHGLVFVDAPVLGTRQPAEDGAVTVLASGPDDVRDRCQPIFDAIASRAVWVGDTGRATRLKLVVNSWVLALTTATAEAMALADGLGLDPKRFLDTIEGGPLDVPYAHLKGGAIRKREFPPAFPLAGALKDAGLIVEAGRVAGVPMRVADAVRGQLAAAAEAGHGDEDMAAVWWALRDR